MTVLSGVWIASGPVWKTVLGLVSVVCAPLGADRHEGRVAEPKHGAARPVVSERSLDGARARGVAS